jgi:hypothetical protein
MAKLSYNLDEIADFNIDQGRYRARLAKVEQTLSSKKKPMLVWYWKIVSGSGKGKEIRSYTSLVEGALGNLKTHLMAFGLHGRVKSDTARLVGKYAIIIVTVGPSNKPGKEDQMFSSVSSVLADKKSNLREDEADDGEVDEDDEEEVDEDTDDENDDEDADEADEEDEDSDDNDTDDEEDEEPSPRRRTTSKPKSKVVTVKKKSHGKIPF